MRPPRSAILASGAATAVMAHQVAAWAARDALFLAVFDLRQLPLLLVASFLASVVVGLPLVRGVARRGSASFLPFGLLVSAALLLVEWAAAASAPRAATIAFCIHVDVVGTLIAAAFLDLADEGGGLRRTFRQVAPLSACVLFGIVLGGVIALTVAARATPIHMLPLLAVLHGVAALLSLGWSKTAEGIRLLRSRTVTLAGQRTEPVDASAPAIGTPAVQPVRFGLRSSYSRRLVIAAVLAAMAAVPLDFLLKQTVVAHTSTAGEMLRFFALLYASATLVASFIAPFLSRVALDRLGPSTIAALPLAVVAGGASVLAVATLVTAVAARGLEIIARRAVFRPAYELLYTPVPRTMRRTTKPFVELWGERLGGALGGAAIAILWAIAPESGLRSLAALGCGIGLVALVAMRRLHAGYVRALEDALARRVVQIDRSAETPAQPATAVPQPPDLRQAWRDSSIAIPIAELQRLLAEQGSATTPRPAAPIDIGTQPSAAKSTGPQPGTTERVAAPTTAKGANGPPRGPLRTLTPITEAMRALGVALQSNDPAAVRRALASPALDRSLVPHVLPLLARDDLAGAAVAALRPLVPQATGMLVDALLDSEEALAVRRRLPRVLAVEPSTRVVEGLLRGLEDPRSEIRLQSGRALARLHTEHPDLAFERDRIMRLVRDEANRGKQVWEGQQHLDADDNDESPLVDEVLRDRANRSLEHVFALLSLVLPLEPLRVAFAGLHCDDEALRATALDYLESVLPADVRGSLWPLLAERRPRPARPAAGRDALQELLGSNASIQINLEELRRRLQQEGS